MNLSQVAAQLYTLRDFTKTPSDIAQTLGRVRAIGYQSVQVSGTGPIDEAKLLQMARDNGLSICATHEAIDALLNTPEQVIERLQKLECKHTALGFPSGVDLASLEGVTEFARRFESSAEKFAAAGLSLSHHNHHQEFRKIGDQTVMDILFQNTKTLGFELDTYWVQFGGANPTSWCQKVAGRSPLLHLKDYAVNSEDKPVFAEIGQGNLEFSSIIAAAEAGGCEWFIVEQDTCPGDPFDSLQISFDYIKSNLVA